MDAREAGELLSCSEDTEEFHDKWQLIMRMHTDKEFTEAVIQHFKPPYMK